MKIPKTINIFGYNYKVTTRPDKRGGQTDNAKKTVEVGTLYNNKEDIVDSLLHEIFEGLLMELGIRYESPAGEIFFIMNHQQFSLCVNEIRRILVQLKKFLNNTL